MGEAKWGMDGQSSDQVLPIGISVVSAATHALACSLVQRCPAGTQNKHSACNRSLVSISLSSVTCSCGVARLGQASRADVLANC